MTIPELDATGQADLVRSGQATPTDLVEASIAVIESTDTALGAVAARTFEQALEHARTVAPGAPFPGVPIMVKDYGLELAGYPRPDMGFGFLFDGPRQSRDTTHVAAGLRAAGFSFLARSTSSLLGTELGTHDPARESSIPRNPWNVGFAAGGSSSGSAVAVASRMTPVAHGNDGGGSLRMPAALCGLVALKPSRGVVSSGPLSSPIVSLLDAQVGDFVITRSVRDSAALLPLLAGRRSGDPITTTHHPSRPTGTLRIGLATTTMGLGIPELEVDPACVRAAEETAALLVELGHQIVPVTPPRDDVFDQPWRYGPPLGPSLPAVAGALDRIGDELGRAVSVEESGRLLHLFAEAGRAGTALQAQEFAAYAQRFAVTWDGWWEREALDALLTPTVTRRVPRRTDFLPPPMGTYAGAVSEDPVEVLTSFQQNLLPLIAFTQAYNITGGPALTLPTHTDPDGLPVGIQLGARHNEDRLLLDLAARLEEHRPWHDRVPSVAV